MSLRRWAVVAALAVLCVVVAALFFPAGRPLTAGERRTLEAVFPPDVDYAAVRIRSAPLPPALTAFVVGDRITFRRGYYVPDFSAHPLRMSQLVHEVAHVRSNQASHGLASARALWEHLRLGAEVYGLDDRPGASRQPLREEQQARLFEELHRRQVREQDHRPR